MKDAAQELIVALKEQLSSTTQGNFERRNQLSKATKRVENLRKALGIERARAVSKGHQLRGARARSTRQIVEAETKARQLLPYKHIFSKNTR